MAGVRGGIFSIVLLVLAAPAGFAQPLAVDATGCLHVVKSGPSGTCSSPNSLRIELTNMCPRPISAQLCMRGANHLWVMCEAQDRLAPKGHFFQSSCDSDGDYTLWGCSTLSKGRDKCGGKDLVGKATNVAK